MHPVLAEHEIFAINQRRQQDLAGRTTHAGQGGRRTSSRRPGDRVAALAAAVGRASTVSLGRVRGGVVTLVGRPA